MASVSIAPLSDRGVVRLSGRDGAKLLQGLITNDIDLLSTQPAIHGGLLSPQGKILFEFFVVNAGGVYLLETERGRAADLAKRLTFYKLRASAEIADVSADYDVFVCWGAPPSIPDTLAGVLAYPDPRLAGLGTRLIVEKAVAGGLPARLGAGMASAEDWHVHRIGLGVPEAGRDYPLGDTFPHEAGFDRLGGVSFSKGCFIGQEVVSRMQHRSAVRKRVVPVQGDGELVSRAEVRVGGAVIGALGSASGSRGLALLRLDRAAEAAAKGETVTAGGVPITLVRPAWADFDVAPASRTEAT